MVGTLDESETLARVDRRYHGDKSPTAPRASTGAPPCQGLYWTPKDTPNPKVALIATHYNLDFSEHYLAPYIAARGFGFLGWNTRYRGLEDQFILEHALIDISVGVKWLREQGVETVVILGNSGGGSLMGAYQAEAVAPTFTHDDELPQSARDALAAMPAADLYIALNAHAGRPQVLTSWLDPSVIDEFDPLATDEALNAFNSDNGPPYAPEFIKRYRAAQVERNHRITAWAKAELERLNAAGTPDRLFPLYRTWADLRTMDPSIEPTDRKPQFCYRGHPAQVNRTPGLGRVNTCKTWLSMWSITDSKCNGEEQLARFDTPAIVLQGTADAGVYPSDANILFNALGTQDKDLHFIKGQHFLEDCVDERNAAADIIVDWVRERI